MQTSDKKNIILLAFAIFFMLIFILPNLWMLFGSFKDQPNVSDVRQTGMVLAIELIKDKKRKTPYNWKERRGRSWCRLST